MNRFDVQVDPQASSQDQAGHYDLDGIPPTIMNEWSNGKQKSHETRGEQRQEKNKYSWKISLDDGDESSMQREALRKDLSRLLAETFRLHLKTQNLCWNSTGTVFESLHEIFDSQCQELAFATDAIADRIRSLGFSVPGTCAELTDLSTIQESQGKVPIEELVTSLCSDQMVVIQTAQAISLTAHELHDNATEALLHQRIQAHQRFSDTLKSLFF